ncbi:MFS transporter [Paraburkholderia sp. BL17N1]|uniref:MFS transporter n=1 Tax=Paraburkholderia sp. BL17N1 TaxID=1938798 RepID=UPI000EB2532C|nr:MFS transporter [Paraburkholderia sp. BL17N1]RKR36069.1 D-galactonate transporter [Paraburkholderia sp. BL17N1]
MNIPSTRLDDGALYRKIAWRIVPFLFVCYVVNFIDRVNIGFAKLHLLRDLKLDDAAFGIAAGMFFVGYLLLELPSNLLLARIGVRKTLLRIMALWGLVTIALMFVQGAKSLYLLRFLLGAAEAGFFPGMIFYLSQWFPNAQRGRITSLFVMAVPLAGIVGGPLSGVIMSQLEGAQGLHGWQWLFLIEGVPAVVLGVLALLLLDDRPADARWLTDDEKARVQAALGAERARREATPAPSSLRELLRSPRVYLLCAVYLTVFMGLNVVGFWIPTVLRQVGVTRITDIGWLSGGMSVLTAIGIVVIGRSSDRRGERRWHVAGNGIGVAASLLLLPLSAHSIALTVALLCVASICIYATLSIFWTIPPMFLSGNAAAGGIALITTVGALGGAVSPALVGILKEQTGSIYVGLAVVAGLLLIGMIALLWFVPQEQPAVQPARASPPQVAAK